MLGELGDVESQEIPEDSHIDGECCQVVSEVALGQHLFDQVDHHLKGDHCVVIFDSIFAVARICIYYSRVDFQA